MQYSLQSADLKIDFGIIRKKLTANESFEMTSFLGTTMLPKAKKINCKESQQREYAVSMESQIPKLLNK